MMRSHNRDENGYDVYEEDQDVDEETEEDGGDYYYDDYGNRRYY